MTKCSKILALVALILAATGSCFAVEFRRSETFEDAYGSSCRVRVNGARGSGIFIGAIGENAYIITNYHVVTTNKTATLDFWTNGKLESITGRIDWRAYDLNMPADFARIVVNAQELKKINPPFTPLGGPDAKPSVGAFIVSSGAPDGRFTQAWKGQVLEYYNGRTCVFAPPPVPGQSGSAICEFVDGELFVTGILTWLLGEKGRDDSKGGAIPISNLYQALQRQPEPASYQETSPIPPNATECVAPDIRVFEFVKKDCPACNLIAPDIDKLIRAGLVERISTDSEDGKTLAGQYCVSELPTVVVVVDGQLKASLKYDEIRKGVIPVITGTVESVKEQLTRENEAQQTLNIPQPTVKEPEQPLDLTPDASSSEQPLTPSLVNPPTYSNKPDFRARPAVYETPYDTGIFAESEQLWRNRGKKNAPDIQDKQQDETPEHRGISGPLRKGVDNLSEEIEGRVLKAVNNLMKDYTTKAQNVLKKAKKTLYATVLFIVVLGVIIAETIKTIIVGVYRKIRSVWTCAVVRAAERLKDKSDLAKNKPKKTDIDSEKTK